MASAVHMVARSSPVVKEPVVPAASFKPNAETRKAMRDARAGKNLTRYPSAKKMFADLGRTEPARKTSAKMGRPRKDIPKNRLQFLRERHKPKGLWLTTAEVAKLLGIAESQVSRHEQHLRGLTDEVVMAYSKLYKVKPHQIFAHLTISK